MMKHENITCEFLYETEDSIYTVRADILAITESNYGADADGNRGVAARWIDDIVVDVLDSRGNNVTNTISKKLKEDILNQVDLLWEMIK